MSNVNSSRKTSRAAEPVRVGGVTPFTTLDYPGQLAAVLFLQGCPWRCHYCHNAEMLGSHDSALIPWPSVLEFLDQRDKLIDAIVFSGGEPTLQSGLALAMQQVKQRGFRIGLHTAGIYPERLRRLLPLVDWIGLDIKASMHGYEKVTGIANSGQPAWQSLRLVVDSGLDYEVRTTLHPRLLDRDGLFELVDELGSHQVKNYALQACIAAHSFNPEYRADQRWPLNEIDIQTIAANFTGFELRKAG